MFDDAGLLRDFLLSDVLCDESRFGAWEVLEGAVVLVEAEVEETTS